MEKLDLYDRDGNLLGHTIERAEKIPQNSYIKIVVLLAKDGQGRWLVQKRASQKKLSPNLWAFTAGTVVSGEQGLAAVLRETYEELGINLRVNLLHKLGTYLGDGFISELWMYHDHLDLEEMVLQRSEVTHVAYMSMDEIRRRIAKGSFHAYSQAVLDTISRQ